jgi:TolA-binding protein
MWSPGVEAGDGPPSSLRGEEEELKDQFQQQQEKIAELKELLKQNEQKLVNKEKEVEVNRSSLMYKIYSVCSGEDWYWGFLVYDTVLFGGWVPAPTQKLQEVWSSETWVPT